MAKSEIRPFFELNTHPYFVELLNHRYSKAVDHGIELLKSVRKLSRNVYNKNSRGTPFYWMGIAAFLSHDFQTAAFLFDAAVSEDLKHARDKPDLPSLLTMQLKVQNKEQAAWEIVRLVVTQVDKTLRNYNQRSGSKKLSLDDVREYFLKHSIMSGDPGRRTLATTFNSFFFEWDYRA
jgi:hypothetical protein